LGKATVNAFHARRESRLSVSERLHSPARTSENPPPSEEGQMASNEQLLQDQSSQPESTRGSECESPQFDQLYVVSDLHIGGERGFQIFTASKLLAGFIRSLIAQPAGEGTTEGGFFPLPGPATKVALVLNGDTVDFLAEDPPAYLDVKGAIRKLRGIIERTPANPGNGFGEVFEALRCFLKVPNRYLVVVLGNHDLELALPHTEAWFEQWLTAGDDAARGRLTFATDGSGYRCAIGSSNVLCFHGEIADDWNRVDHQGLRGITHRWKAGMTEFDWTPSGGTQLVRDVMNEVKREFPFVDLLKPETEAVLPILKMLNTATFSRAFGATSAFMNKLSKGILRDRFLSIDGQPAAAKPEDLLLRSALQLLDSGSATSLSAAERAEQDIRQGADPVELARQEAAADDLLSLRRILADVPGSLYARFIERKTPVQTLRASLEYLLDADDTFELQTEDEPYGWAKDHVSPAIHFVVAGHTHLARRIMRPNGWYFNCGTWANLIRLNHAQLATDDAFQDTFNALTTSKTVLALQERDLAHTVPTVVSITAPDPKAPATGRLHLARDVAGQVRLIDYSETTPPAR
jgi:hypothetical protein